MLSLGPKKKLSGVLKKIHLTLLVDALNFKIKQQDQTFFMLCHEVNPSYYHTMACIGRDLKKFSIESQYTLLLHCNSSRKVRCIFFCLFRNLSSNQLVKSISNTEEPYYLDYNHTHHT